MMMMVMQLPDLCHRLVSGWRGAGQLRAGEGDPLQHGAHLHTHHAQGGTLAVCRLTKVMADRNHYEGDLETDKSAQNIKVAAIYFCVVMNFPTLPFFIFCHRI